MTSNKQEKLPAKRLFIKVFKKHLGAEHRVFLFGSRANGKAHGTSDFDIGIEGPNPVPQITMAKIRDEMENLPTLYKIDIVDFNKVSRDFYSVAKSNITPIL